MRALALCLLLSAGPAAAAEPPSDAREIARWLSSSGRDLPEGRVWPVDPEKPEEVLTHFRAFEKGEKPGFTLPDSLFPP
jgi:hypothetical protein